MDKIKDTWKRLLALAMSLILLIGVIPEGALGVYAEESASFGSVTATDAGLTVSDNGTENVTVSVSDLITLNWVAKNDKRGQDGWWAGFKLTAPDTLAEDATYTINKSTKKFSDNKDSVATDAKQYIWLYGLVTPEYLKIAGTRTMSYTWEFDWNADGTNEQKITLRIEPAKVVLNKDGGRVYPSVYGTLTNTYGGTLSGEDTADTVLTLTRVAVKYDTEAKAWRVDTTVTAPKHITTALEGDKPFTSPATYYLVLEPKDGNYTVSGEQSWNFQWDGVAQRMKLVVDNVILEKADQAPLNFAVPTPETQLLINGSFTNAATGGSVDGMITYESSDSNVATVDKNGKVTFAALGSVTITATKAGNEYYKNVSASYSLTVANTSWGLQWATPAPGDFEFGTNGNQFRNAAQYPNEEGTMVSDGVTYEITENVASGADPAAAVAEVDEDTGILTILHPGTVTVKASKAGDTGYDAQEITYTLNIIPGSQTLAITGEQTIVHDGDRQYTYVITGVTSAGNTTVSSSDEAVAAAELNEDENIVVTPKGKGTFTLTVENTGDEFMAPGKADLTITVLEAQSKAAFEKPEDVVVTYNDNGNRYSNKLIGIMGTGALTYTSSDTSVATVDSDGNVTIQKAGEVTITATKLGDGEYDGVTRTYKLTIRKADQVFGFEIENPVVKVGSQEYQQTLNEQGAGTGVILYSVEDGATLEYGSFDTASGKITLLPGKAGSVKIRATKAADECYNEASDVYTLTVEYEATPDAPYTLEGAKADDASAWFIDNVTIKPKNGYKISFSNDFDDWKEALPYSNEGQSNLTVYLMNVETGGITDGIPVQNLWIDKTLPTGLSISYSNDVLGEVLEKLTFGFYNAQMTVTIHAEDTVSGVAAIHYNYNGEWNEAAPDKDGNIQFTIDPEYRGNVKYFASDKAGNGTEEKTGQATLIVDSIKPGINVTWSDADTVATDKTRYYGDQAVATVVIKEANFFDGEGVNIKGGTFDGEWTEAKDESGAVIADTWMNTVTLTDEGTYTISITYADRSQNEMDAYASETIVVDKTAPVIKLEETLDGTCTNETVTTQITVVDQNFDVSKVEVTLEGKTPEVAAHTVQVTWDEAKDKQGAVIPDTYVASVEVSDDAVYTLKVSVEDPARYTAKAEASFTVDKTAPVNVEFTYSDDVWGKVLEGVTFGYYKAPMNVTIHAEDVTSGVAEIHYNYKGEWEKAAPDEDGNVQFTVAPEYRGNVKYHVSDKAGNDSEEMAGQTTLIVDTIKPGINVTWSDADNVAEDNTRYYGEKAVATVVIKEVNFFDGEDVKIEDGMFDGDWTAVDGEADTWMNTVTLDTEGTYNVRITYADRSQNEMDAYTSETIVVDKTAPVIKLEETLDGTCTNETVITQITVVERNFEASEVEVTLEGKTPDVAAHIVQTAWNQAKDKQGAVIPDTYVATVEAAGDSVYTLKISVKDPLGLSAEAEASFTVDKTDPVNVEISYSKNIKDKIWEALTFGFYNAPMTVTIHAEDVTSGVAKIHYNCKDEWKEAAPDEKGNIQFTIDPQYRGNVTYYASDKAGNGTENVTEDVILVVDTVKPSINVAWSEANTVEEGKALYYGEKAVATVVITEANFFNGEDVKIKGGTFDGEWTTVDGQADAWMNTVTLDTEGEYTIGITYTDNSLNEMDAYTSETIVIDHTDPRTSASIETGSDRKYYNETQTITITVMEKYFDPDKVDISIDSRDSSGADVESGVTYGEWTDKGGDVHTLDIHFAGDANYTLNATCTDKGGRTASIEEQRFTVDKTAPASLAITYSTSVYSQILNGITFGYYRAPVTVTLTAVDAGAGVDGFEYQYLLNTGVSSVNSGGSGKVTASQSGNTYTATFQIPPEALNGSNQFNGYVTVTATDRSGNASTQSTQGTQRVIADNISPTSNVTYNAPRQEVNGISYYAENIEGTINIREANFDHNDVTVTVTKDGAAYGVNVNWNNNNADDHVGRFTLTEDGDYVVSVSYTDKSGNTMAQYTSNRLTLDTAAPVVRTSNIKANSANKDDKYGFAITIEDENLDVAAMKPVLKAVLQDESGRYRIEEINLGDPTAVEENRIYTYTVEDLPEDALYTLTCEAVDLAGNVMNSMELDDGKTYETVQFSINRNGSVFGYGDEDTEKVVNQYYVYEVPKDLVIYEINVDPIEDYAVLINGEELKEGVDYNTSQTSESGQWSKRTYVIHKERLGDEGEYNIVVSSKDKAETTSYSDVKNLAVVFVVDKTAPVLTITGIENSGRYQTNEQTVTAIPTDEGGRIRSLAVRVLTAKGVPLTDREGKDISVRFEMSGEELLKYLEENDGKVTFTVPEGLNLQVQVICDDCAVKADGTTNTFSNTFERVTVSQNQFVIFYANTPLLVGTIAGILAIAALITLLLKRRKEKSKAR